jgi:hypothetical protein
MKRYQMFGNGRRRGNSWGDMRARADISRSESGLQRDWRFTQFVSLVIEDAFSRVRCASLPRTETAYNIFHFYVLFSEQQVK